MSGPLLGMRVLDLTSVVMGPYATQLLGDLGADVITVEPPGGEVNRSMGPGPHPGLSGVALNLLRNKRNIRLDLKTAAGREAALRLAATCDALVTNLRPASLEGLGLSYASVAEVAPALVYCQAHGYPASTSRADEPAYDDVVQSAAGMADVVRRATGVPGVVPTILADKVCGLVIVAAVSAALVHRAATGRGQHVEVPMVEAFSSFLLVEHGGAAVPEPPLGAAGYSRALAPHRGPQRSADGWVHVMPYGEREWRLVLTHGGLGAAADSRLGTVASRAQHAESLYQDLARAVATLRTDEWLSFCREHQVAVSEVVDLDELVERLPVIEHPAAGRYRVTPVPARFSATPGGVGRPAPLAGQHTDEVLEEAGYDRAGREELRRRGALGPPGA